MRTFEAELVQFNDLLGKLKVQKAYRIAKLKIKAGRNLKSNNQTGRSGRQKQVQEQGCRKQLTGYKCSF